MISDAQFKEIAQGKLHIDPTPIQCPRCGRDLPLEWRIHGRKYCMKGGMRAMCGMNDELLRWRTENGMNTDCDNLHAVLVNSISKSDLKVLDKYCQKHFGKTAWYLLTFCAAEGLKLYVAHIEGLEWPQLKQRELVGVQNG